MSPGITHLFRASTVCAPDGTFTSARAPMSRIFPFSMTMAALRMAARPVPVMTVAPWITTIPAGCCAKSEAARTSIRKPLIFHVLMFAFFKQDLNSLLSHERKHDERAERIAPSQVHAVIQQGCN